MSERTLNSSGVDESPEPDDGGAAFPVPYPGGQVWAPGMTLRDYFAGQALAGIMSIRHMVDHEPEEDISDRAYMQADAMLKVRQS